MQSDDHKKMVAALQKIVIPRLRERGFKGSFPHFRRQTDDEQHLLSFQFDRWGGGFFIELAKCGADGYTTYWDEHIPPQKMTPMYLPNPQRGRLYPGVCGSRGDWFRYDKPEKLTTTLINELWTKFPFLRKYLTEPAGIYGEVAESVLPFLDKAEKMWR